MVDTQLEVDDADHRGVVTLTRAIGEMLTESEAEQRLVQRLGEIAATGVFNDTAYPPNYDVSKDSELLFLRETEQMRFTGEVDLNLIVVDNWFEELNRLAPANQN